LQKQARLLLVGLLQGLNLAPLQRQERVLLQDLVQTVITGLEVPSFHRFRSPQSGR
jgi:hypothetical protein